jgi:Flp pilus assembly protein CpaB
MEMEYKDPSRRGRWIVLLGVVLAVVAGGAAFFLINNAQQKASTTGLKTVSGYVAARPILAKKPMVAEDLVLRNDIPLDGTNASSVVTDSAVLIDHLLAVDVPQGQLLTTNLLASGTVGLGFSILRPDETVAPDSEAWRAVAITVSDDRAVGGVVGAGMNVDVFVTATVGVEPPAGPAASPAPGAVTTAVSNNALGSGYYPDRSTKVTYQGMTILSRSGTYYILRVPLAVAEEIAHMQADGTAQFSLALRPDQDQRILDVSGFGATTNRIIERYGLPVPETVPSRGRPYPTNPPIPELTPPPSPVASGDLGNVPAPSAATP